MSFIDYIKRPEYYLQPSFIFNRFRTRQPGLRTYQTSWGSSIDLKPNENIGKAIARTGVYDLAASETLWRLIEPGDFILDIGANIGYTVNLCSFRAGTCGKVWAFEPNPFLLSRLEKNINHLSHQNCSLLPFALSDKNEEGFLILPNEYSSNEGTAFLGEEGGGTSVKVNMRRLDDLLQGHEMIHLMKIDVEGHELSVLQGAESLLTKNKIENIVFEDFMEYPSAVSKFLSKRNYKIFRIEKSWMTILLKDPDSRSGVSPWEPTNYLATCTPEKTLKKFTSANYLCLQG